MLKKQTLPKGPKRTPKKRDEKRGEKEKMVVLFSWFLCCGRKGKRERKEKKRKEKKRKEKKRKEKKRKE